jgi:hypothetical protein
VGVDGFVAVSVSAVVFVGRSPSIRDLPFREVMAGGAEAGVAVVVAWAVFRLLGVDFLVARAIAGAVRVTSLGATVIVPGEGDFDGPAPSVPSGGVNRSSKFAIGVSS